MRRGQRLRPIARRIAGRTEGALAHAAEEGKAACCTRQQVAVKRQGAQASQKGEARTLAVPVA
eukprot:1207629-Prymnesium_polylepis.1